MLAGFCLCRVSEVKGEDANYDESKMPAFTLPDPLVMCDGSKVESARMWKKKRRPEIVSLFEEYVYGRAPNPPKRLFEVVSVDENALGGKAVRKEVSVYLAGSKEGPKMDVLIYLPAGVKKPVPLFVGMNFHGNQTIDSDPGITITKQWVPNNEKSGFVENKATEASRGTSSKRWPILHILERGYGVATVYCGDVDPDFHDEFKNGIHPFFYKEDQTKPAPDEWGSIAAWAWGLSRALDYFEKDKNIDADHIAVIGHSRLGKTALWAGARDERFAAVISNNSGCGGAALSRRRIGESVERINRVFPHWFCGNFKKYDNNEDACPVDQHMLVALVAPRPVYIASAEGDKWADPHGEFLAGLYSDPVYKLLGKEGLPVDKMPAVDQPVMGTTGYHIRTGVHDITMYDWDRYMDFTDKHGFRE